MNVRGIIASCLIGASLCTASAAFAQETVISPETIVSNSNIDSLNIRNNVFSYYYGSGEGGDDNTVIMPITVADNVNAFVVNAFNTIVNVDINICLDDISDMIAATRAEMMNNTGK